MAFPRDQSTGKLSPKSHSGWQTALLGAVCQTIVPEQGLGPASKASNLTLTDLLHAVGGHRQLADQPFTLRGSEYAHAAQELNKALDRAQRALN
jgi:hypothetical protein